MANSFAGGPVIFRLDPASGSLLEISRNGAQGDLFRRPYDLDVEPDGSLVVADLGEPNRRDGAVIRVDPLTGRQSLVSSGGLFFDPAGIAVGPGGQLWVVDNRSSDNDGAVIRVDPRTGAQTLVSASGRLDLPFGVAVQRDGSLLVTNRQSPGLILPTCQPLGRLVRVDPANGAQQLVAQGGLLGWPLGVAANPDGSSVVVNECAATNALVRVAPAGGGQSVLSANARNDVLVTPERIAVDPAGALLVSDYALGGGDGGVARVDPGTGAQTLVSADPVFEHPLGIAAVVNRPPQARLALDPPVVAAGRRVELDASASTDPEGLRLVYEWDLDEDGSFEAGSGIKPTAWRAFSRNGPATVRVRAHDPHGGRSETAATVTVDGAVPVIERLRSSARTLGVRARKRKRSRGRRADPWARAARRGPAARARAGGRGPDAGSERSPRASAQNGPGGRRRGSRSRRPPRSTTLAFELSEPATVTLAVERARVGRRRGPTTPCRPRARRGRRCVLWSRVRHVERNAAAGPNRVRLRARGLRPGRHRLRLSATDAVGNVSATRSLTLRVVRVKR